MKTLVLSVAVLALVAGCATPSASRPATAPSASSATAVSPASSATPDPTPVEITPTPAPPLPSIEDAGATRIEISPGADWLAIAGGSTWTAAGPGIVQLDPATGARGAFTQFLGICVAFDVGYDSLWSASCDEPLLGRFDPTDGSVIATVTLPVQGIQDEGSVAAGEGGVWAVSRMHELVKVDPGTDTVVGTWDLPMGAAAVRAGLGALWVTVSPTDTLLRIDPADPTRRTAIATGTLPRFLAIGEGAVWVMNQRDGTVTRVAPDGTVEATIAASDGPIEGGDIAVGGGRVWVRSWRELVVGIDPATNTVVERYGPVSGSGSVVADDEALWVSAHDVEAIWRLPLVRAD